MTITKKLNILLWGLLFFPCFSFAVSCQYYNFLSPQFNLNEVRECQNYFATCPKNGPYIDVNCLQTNLKKYPVCTQLLKLAKTLKTNPAALTFEKQNNFIIVTQTFGADGQQFFYIISPKNCVLNTNIDPRTINAKLKTKYKNTIFITLNTGKPKQEQSNQKISFLTKLKINKNCLACETLGDATIRYTFNKAGQLLNVQLEDFSLRK